MNKFLYFIGYSIYYLYFSLFPGWKIKGKNNLPNSDSLIVVANHISALDPPLVACVMNRPVHFIAKRELFKNPIAGWFLENIGCIPIARGKPDRNAIRRSLNVLLGKNVLGLFPEGTRHEPGQTGDAKPGTVLIALKSKSPILPIGIKNVKNKKKIKVSIGQTFTLDSFYDRKLSREEKKEVGNIIMGKIKDELDKIQ